MVGFRDVHGVEVSRAKVEEVLGHDVEFLWGDQAVQDHMEDVSDEFDAHMGFSDGVTHVVMHVEEGGIKGVKCFAFPGTLTDAQRMTHARRIHANLGHPSVTRTRRHVREGIISQEPGEALIKVAERCERCQLTMRMKPAAAVSQGEPAAGFNEKVQMDFHFLDHEGQSSMYSRHRLRAYMMNSVISAKRSCPLHNPSTP